MMWCMNADQVGPYVKCLGLELDAADGDEVTAHWHVHGELLQPYGILHGGAHCSVVETLASVGAALWLGDKGKVVGASNSTDFFRPVTEGADLRSVARPIHRGRTQQVWVVETVDERD